MKLRDMNPGPSGRRPISGQRLAMGLASAGPNRKNKRIFRLTLSEDLLTAAGLKVGDKVEVDIDNEAGLIYLYPSDNGWRVIPMLKGSPHGMLVPTVTVTDMKKISSKEVDVVAVEDKSIVARMRPEIMAVLSGVTND